MSLLSLKGVSFYRGECPVVNAVSLSVEPGQMIGILGANGAGKTTLLSLMAGLISPSAGQIEFSALPLHTMPLKDRARHISYLAQAMECSWPLTTEQVVMMGRIPHLSPFRKPEQCDYDACNNAMHDTGCEAFRTRSVLELSGGERARVLLARALATRPQLLLADEPVSGLDPYHQHSILHMFSARAAEGMAVVTVLHDLLLASRYCSSVVILHKGELLAAGSPQEVLTPAIVKQVFGMELGYAELQGKRLPLPYLDMQSI